MNNDPKPQPAAVLQVSISEDADKWTTSVLQKSDHGWHGLSSCQTCSNRYMTLVTAFDAGYEMGREAGLVDGRKQGIAEEGSKRFRTHRDEDDGDD